jgi:hypothetical protein
LVLDRAFQRDKRWLLCAQRGQLREHHGVGLKHETTTSCVSEIRSFCQQIRRVFPHDSPLFKKHLLVGFVEASKVLTDPLRKFTCLLGIVED